MYTFFIGALYLDGGWNGVIDFFDKTMFMECNDNPLYYIWNSLPRTKSKKQQKEEEDNILDSSSNGIENSISPNRYDSMKLDDDTIKLFGEVEDKIGIRFRDKSLLIQAFTHPTFYRRYNINSYPNIFQSPNYQRMEFLGDSILDAVISLYLYNQFPTADEGQMSIRRYANAWQ
jgi:dsRNA-specific ribonuclease